MQNEVNWLQSIKTERQSITFYSSVVDDPHWHSCEINYVQTALPRKIALAHSLNRKMSQCQDVVVVYSSNEWLGHSLLAMSVIFPRSWLKLQHTSNNIYSIEATQSHKRRPADYDKYITARLLCTMLSANKGIVYKQKISGLNKISS